jgi:CRP/FNR family cyclic AMP-dependent transcriptional regulator
LAKPRLTKANFNAKAFLSKVGDGRSLEHYPKGRTVFHQGDAADAVFFIQKGKVKVAVVSEQGKEAVVAFMSADDFIGEACLAGQTQRIATATAVADSMIVRLERMAIIHLIHPSFT